MDSNTTMVLTVAVIGVVVVLVVWIAEGCPNPFRRPGGDDGQPVDLGDD